ncbi:MAG TPA: response regulator [Bryobacteraceae bacterium]|jgi:CheY-like chemotaxis protein
MNVTGQRPLLVIEDNDHDYAILEMCLRNVGVPNQLVRCAGGEEIDAYLKQDFSSHSDIPTFIFLDLNLPGTEGRQVLNRLKLHPALAPVPVVVLTTSSRPRDVELSYKLGAAGFLTKPIDLAKFETMVQHVADYWFSCVKLPESVGFE